MAASEVNLIKPGTDQQPGVFSWLVTLAACVYILWIGISLYRVIGIFSNMFASLGVELGIATRLVIGAYRLAFPILFGGAAGVVLTKQWFVRDKWANVSFSLGVAFVVDFVGGLIVQSLYAPLLDLVEKLNK